MIELIRMLLQVLLVPALMILAGHLMGNQSKKQRNRILGYRSRRSGGSQETWEFANRYCGRLYEQLGLRALVPSGVLLVLLRTGESTVHGILLLQCILLLIPVFLTERALKQKE